MYSQKTIDDLANRLGIDPTLFSDLVKRRANLYKVWYRKNSGGKKRCVEEPLEDLKTVQRVILDKFNLKFPKCVQGGIIGRSIRTNALEHKNGKYLLRMDIKDAYPSSTKKQVYVLFRKFGAPAEEARIITKLTTFRGHLPQGAPTSLALFNFLLSNTGIDKAASRIRGIKYTRYVDDLVFTSKRRIPKNLKKEVVVLLKEYGFSINPKKTRRYSIKNRALRVTGVNIIGGKPKVPPKMIKRFRGMIGRATIDGSVSKTQVFGIIAFVIGIERKIPNQLLRPLLHYLKTKDVKDCPFVIY
ncbi:MAG: reverse transcriptase family protein [Patescibacteria group bacterium]